MDIEDRLKAVTQRETASKKDFKNRCLMVIQTLVGGDIVYEDIEQLKTEIYTIAHIALGTCENKHEDWIEETENMFKKFEKMGLL